MSDWLVTIVLGLIAAWPGLLALWMQRKKQAAEAKKENASADSEMVKSALVLIEPLKTQLKEELTVKAQMREEIDTLKTQMITLMADYEMRIDGLEKKLQKLADILDEILGGAHKLNHQVKSMGGVPVYDPPERRKDWLENGETGS